MDSTQKGLLLNLQTGKEVVVLNVGGELIYLYKVSTPNGSRMRIVADREKVLITREKLEQDNNNTNANGVANEF